MAKRKLRPVTDIMARLRWDDADRDAADDVVLIGYDDRVNGPMEVPLADFIPISRGGDVPEHRVTYVRTSRGGIVWDRAARVDKVFGSGEGRDAPLAPTTLANARAAEATMGRLEAERTRTCAIHSTRWIISLTKVKTRHNPRRPCSRSRASTPTTHSRIWGEAR